MSTKLFVGSLPWSINDQSLEEAFQKYGTVVSAKVITDRATGRSKGFAFVEMSSANEAKDAMRELNNSQLNGRNIVVNEANARS
ncbi:MAG: RNA-binding protein [Bacteroidota bacterium]|nr:RNA-binding protein [Bacteroidota bacterium]MDP4196596.1 RNA-binding protein [Bacteroidota bacterium]